MMQTSPSKDQHVTLDILTRGLELDTLRDHAFFVGDDLSVQVCCS